MVRRSRGPDEGSDEGARMCWQNRRKKNYVEISTRAGKDTTMYHWLNFSRSKGRDDFVSNGVKITPEDLVFSLGMTRCIYPEAPLM